MSNRGNKGRKVSENNPQNMGEIYCSLKSKVL